MAIRLDTADSHELRGATNLQLAQDKGVMGRGRRPVVNLRYADNDDDFIANLYVGGISSCSATWNY